MKYKKQTAIRDKMLQFSKLQMKELDANELASLMLALPSNHPLFFEAWAEVERRKMECFNKMPQDMKDFISNAHIEEDEAFMKLVHAADWNRADTIVKHLSEKRGRLN